MKCDTLQQYLSCIQLLAQGPGMYRISEKKKRRAMIVAIAKL